MTGTMLQAQLDFLGTFIRISGFQSSARGLAEAVPHLNRELTADDIPCVLQNLDIPVETAAGNIASLTQEDCPCLFVDPQGGVELILDTAHRRYHVLDVAKDTAQWCDRTNRVGTILRIASARSKDQASVATPLRSALSDYRPVLASLLFASSLSSLLGLTIPIVIMVIYDRAIPTHSLDLVAALALGMSAVIAADLALRHIRGRAVAYMASRMERRMNIALFRKLCTLPVAQIDKSGVDQQIARLRQFESLRDLFTGPLFSTLMDLPFTLLFVAVTFMLSVTIGWIVLAAGLALCALAILALPTTTRLGAAQIRARNAAEAITYETVLQQKAIAELGAQDVWLRRSSTLTRESCDAARRSRQFQAMVHALGQGIMSIAGIGGILVGAMLAMAGELSLGALIAVMALVWKSLAPFQALLSSLPQLQSLRRNSDQISRVMALPDMFVRGAALSSFKSFQGAVNFQSVTHRFPNANGYALTQVNLEIPTAQCLVICGKTGSGKSLLLDLMDGLDTPTAGTISLDGVNLQQIAVDDLRNAISYARQDPQFFHGTILQNIRLSAPTADDARIRSELDKLGLLTALEGLPEGLETRMNEAFRTSTPHTLLQQLNLARCLAKDAQIYLFDDPGNGLDDDASRALTERLRQMKGARTLILTSNQDAHIQLADRMIFLDRGRVVVDDNGISGQQKVRALINAKGGPKHV